jgi:hypothetical protein
MINEEKQLNPPWPGALADVDVSKLRFVIDFLSPCSLQPADFLGLGRVLRLTGRQLFDSQDVSVSQQWEALFQPQVSDDPVARRKFQKPAPAFVMTMPLEDRLDVDVGDRLILEVLFIGTGISSIHHFLRSLLHLGQLGLVAGEGRYDVIEVEALQPEGKFERIWRQTEPVSSLTCPVQSLLWLVQKEQVRDRIVLNFVTPTRLMRDGKPLRQPRFSHVFPFMLRRVTSILHAHCGLEVCDDPGQLIMCASEIETEAKQLSWQDWRSVTKSKDLSVGGFVGQLKIAGGGIEEIFWVLAVASLLGIGKGATYGAGRVEVLAG